MLSPINRRRFPQGWQVVKKSILSGLHHEYDLKKVAA
jgi:hypothetical protein